MTDELNRAEDLEYSDIPTESYSLFGDIIDILSQSIDPLLKDGIKSFEDTFLETRYYINQHHSDLLQRSTTLSQHRKSHDYQELPFSNSSSGSPLLRTCSTKLTEEGPNRMEVQRVISNVVPHHSPNPLEGLMPKSKVIPKFCHLVEFLLIIQELTQVYIHHINILLKAESNSVRKLDLYFNLVHLASSSGKTSSLEPFTSTKSLIRFVCASIG
jgi:hypothetical protein